MSPTRTPLALAALVLFAGSVAAVPAADAGPPAPDTDPESVSFAPVPVYGPTLEEPVYTLLASDPPDEMVYGPDYDEDQYDLRVLPDDWHQLTADGQEDVVNPWDDRRGAATAGAAPQWGGDGASASPSPSPSASPSPSPSPSPCGCHTGAPSTDDGMHDGDDVEGDGAHDGDDVEGDGTQDGDDLDDAHDGDDSDDDTDQDADN